MCCFVAHAAAECACKCIIRFMKLMNKGFLTVLPACKEQKDSELQSQLLTWTVDEGLLEPSTRQIYTQTSSSISLPRLRLASLARPTLPCLNILSATSSKRGKNMDLSSLKARREQLEYLPACLPRARLVRFSTRLVRSSCYQKLP